MAGRTGVTRSYAFDISAEIISDKPFDEIPIAELCAAMRARLDRVEQDNMHEAFVDWDSYVEEEE